MSFASLARVAAPLILAAFAAGCAAEEVSGTKVRNGNVSNPDGDSADPSPNDGPGSSDRPNSDIAKPVTPATPPAAQSTAPAVKPAAEKPPIACATDVDSVTRSYFVALQRTPDEGGLQTWVGAIQQGETRLGVLKRILQSTEFLASREQLTNSEYVVSLYRSFFDREPDAGGFATWVGNLDSGGTRPDVAIAFADSEEFKSPASNRATACYF